MNKTYDELHKRMLMSAEYHEMFESEKWQKLIPAFKIKPDWLIQIIPPFVSAIVRFRISKENFKDDQYISVYLDCYDLIGYMGGPYWEAYPVDGDVCRCAMDDIKRLMKCIETGLQQIEEDNSGKKSNNIKEPDNVSI